MNHETHNAHQNDGRLDRVERNTAKLGDTIAQLAEMVVKLTTKIDRMESAISATEASARGARADVEAQMKVAFIGSLLDKLAATVKDGIAFSVDQQLKLAAFEADHYHYEFLRKSK
jgi:hypothetical protein